MDVEPIYCAEQIAIPHDLADILKAYTKEVIRRQPQDLIEFSAKYFANLANVANSVQSVPAPSKDQLRLVYSRAGGSAELTAPQVEALCNQAGIAKAVTAKVLEAGRFTHGVAVDKFVFLMLAMGCADFSEVLRAIFDVFGEAGSLSPALFTQLIGYLQGDMDPDVTTQFMLEVQQGVAECPVVTYAQAASIPVIARKLGLLQ